MNKSLEDVLDDLIWNYGEGPELAFDIVSRLYMAKRGKHGDPEPIVEAVIADLRSIADQLEAAL